MKLDMHVHSTFSSDGTATPKDILRKARKIGLGGLCISDHNTLRGNIEARKIAQEFNLLLVSGMEISSTEGHILGYGLSEEVPKGLSPEETLERIHAQGGISVIAHPYRPWSGLGEKVACLIKPDAIEVQNSHSTARENAKALRLCQSLDLPMTAGSDAHMLSYVGRSITLLSDASSEDDVLEAIRKGRTKIGGKSRSTGGAIKDRTDTVLQWMGRGFKKM